MPSRTPAGCPAIAGRDLRQKLAEWVLSLPWSLRYQLAFDAALCRDVLAVFIRVVFGWWRRWAARGPGREAAGREADPDTLPVSRSVLVTKTDAGAEDYLGDLMPGHPKLSAHPSAATSRRRR